MGDNEDGTESRRLRVSDQDLELPVRVDHVVKGVQDLGGEAVKTEI